MWITRLKLKKISKYGVIICLTISAVFAAFSIYGSQIGKLTINANDSEIALALHDDESLLNPKSRLSFPGLADMGDTTYTDLFDVMPNTQGSTDTYYDYYKATIGSNNDELNRRFLTFTFLLQNTSSVSANIEFTVRIMRATKGIDSAFRLLVVEDETQTIYAKVKETEDLGVGGVGDPEDYPTTYTTTPFLSDDIICSYLIHGLASKDTIRYTVILWLEGNDKQCTDDIKGGKLQLYMEFNGSSAE